MDYCKQSLQTIEKQMKKKSFIKQKDSGTKYNMHNTRSVSCWICQKTFIPKTGISSLRCDDCNTKERCCICNVVFVKTTAYCLCPKCKSDNDIKNFLVKNAIPSHIDGFGIEYSMDASATPPEVYMDMLLKVTYQESFEHPNDFSRPRIIVKFFPLLKLFKETDMNLRTRDENMINIDCKHLHHYNMTFKTDQNCHSACPVTNYIVNAKVARKSDFIHLD